MILRQADHKDARAIAEVHVSSWQTTYAGQVPESYLHELSVPQREAAWTEALADSSHKIIVAEEGGEVHGFISFGPSRDADANPSVGEIYAIYLLENYKGCGVGIALWNEALRSLKQRSCNEVTLWVLDTNNAARRFYTRVGMLPDGATKSEAIGEQKVIELRYRMSLE